MFRNSSLVLVLAGVVQMLSVTQAVALTQQPPFKTIEEVKSLKESLEPSFFAIQGIHSVGISLCSRFDLKVPSQEKYCISVGAESEDALIEFEAQFPQLEVDGTPIGLELYGPIVIQPGVVVAD
jgi:hypothetical protein